MIYYFKLFFIGIIIGIGKILPGVSGALFAISFGVYESIIRIISSFPSLNRKDFIFSFCLGLGFIIAVFVFSRYLYFMVDNYYTYIIFFMVGYFINYFYVNKSKKNIILLFLSTILFIIVYNLDVKFNIIHSINPLISFILGIIEGISMIIPGISGSAILMILSIYDEVIYKISVLDLSFVISYFLGIIIIVLFISKILSKIIYKNRLLFEKIIYVFTCFGFLYMVSLINILNVNGLIILLFGFVIGNIFER